MKVYVHRDQKLAKKEPKKKGIDTLLFFVPVPFLVCNLRLGSSTFSLLLCSVQYP